MDKLEELRGVLNELIANDSNKKDIITASKRLDKEIVKFMRQKDKIVVKQ